MLLDAYDSFSGDIIGGSFITPYLLADTDDDGYDDTDEYWRLDPMTGAMIVGPQRVVFSCVLPKDKRPDNQPFPVAFFGHGYGSSRFDMFGFAWALNRVGIAACAMDFPGHGPSIGGDDLIAVEAILDNLRLLPFLDHLLDSRQRDIDNDGEPESGADQWIADSFHTRDMIRQAAIDHSQLIRALRACGQHTMDSEDGDRVTCDWDDDGEPDIGGPDVDFYLLGGSLGGINTAVTAAVEPELTASASIVGAGGLMDVGIRTPLGGAVEAVMGRLITPLILGTPDELGNIVLSQHVISGQKQRNIPFGIIPGASAGGEILVENLSNGEERLFSIPDTGQLRVPIPADAMDAHEKRVAAGIPLEDFDGEGIFSVEDNEGLGDTLRITVWGPDGAEIATIDTFEIEGFFEGITYPKGSPLVATSEGLGHQRGSPSLRRLASFVAMVIEGGDPIAYARYYLKEPIGLLGGHPTNILMVPTPGDMIVAINAEIALARAAGMVDYENVDPRYGMTVDQWLIDRQVVRGLEQFGPWVDAQGQPALFDADDLDNGTDIHGAPSDAPLRVTIPTTSGVSGMRLPYVAPTGSHGFGLPDPDQPFDINTFSVHQIARYFQTRGQILSDDPCMADHTCAWLPPFVGGVQ